MWTGGDREWKHLRDVGERASTSESPVPAGSGEAERGTFVQALKRARSGYVTPRVAIVRVAKRRSGIDEAARSWEPTSDAGDQLPSCLLERLDRLPRFGGGP